MKTQLFILKRFLGIADLDFDHALDILNDINKDKDYFINALDEWVEAVNYTPSNDSTLNLVEALYSKIHYDFREEITEICSEFEIEYNDEVEPVSIFSNYLDSRFTIVYDKDREDLQNLIDKIKEHEDYCDDTFSELVKFVFDDIEIEI